MPTVGQFAFRFCGQKILFLSLILSASTQVSAVLMDLGGLLKSAASAAAAARYAVLAQPQASAAAAAAAAREAEANAEDKAAEAVKEGLRALLQPSAIILPAYDGAGNITLERGRGRGGEGRRGRRGVGGGRRAAGQGRARCAAAADDCGGEARRRSVGRGGWRCSVTNVISILRSGVRRVG